MDRAICASRVRRDAHTSPEETIWPPVAGSSAGSPWGCSSSWRPPGAAGSVLELSIGVDNTEGPKTVTVTVDSSGPGMTGGEDVIVAYREGAGRSVPLGSTRQVKVDGKHVIGSDDPTGFALRQTSHGRTRRPPLRVARDGTVTLLDAP